MGCSVSVVLLFKRGWDLVSVSVGAECVCLTGAICPACGHWWHLCVHFQDVLGKPSRKMFWCRQKWSFLKASEEMDKWLDSGGTTLGNSRDLILCTQSFSLITWYFTRAEPCRGEGSGRDERSTGKEEHEWSPCWATGEGKNFWKVQL